MNSTTEATRVIIKESRQQNTLKLRLAQAEARRVRDAFAAGPGALISDAIGRALTKPGPVEYWPPTPPIVN